MPNDALSECSPCIGKGFAKGEGPRPAPIMFVGEALGKNEVVLGRPFVGGTGRMLRIMISHAGILPTDFYITNTVKCQPPDNRTPTKGEANACASRYLWDEIREVSPNILVPVGQVALATIMPHAPAGVTSVRGSLFNTPWGKVIPIVHPSFVAQGNPEYWAITVHDLKRIKHESLTKVYNEPNLKLNLNLFPTAQDVVVLVEMLLAKKLKFAWDLETVGTRWQINIMDWGIAWSDRDALCVPFLKRGGYPYWSEYDEDKVCEALWELMTSNLTKITQNGFTFDMPVLMDQGWRVEPPCIDTLVRHHVIATELPHSLEFLTSAYTSLPYYKMDVKAAGGMLWAPDEVRRRYNCFDCISTYIASDEIDKEMLEEGLL
jgi:uracil-DNA glycosylase